jgi:hypothetical protein
MGMFDYIITTEGTQFTCGEGHPGSDWQTKSLDCTMDEYVLDSTGLYLKKRSSTTRTFEDGAMVKRWDLVFQSTLTGYLNFYAWCRKCSAAFSAQDGNRLPRKYLNDVEYGVYIKAGKIVDINPVTVRTLEQNLQYIKESYPDAQITLAKD